MKLKNLTGNDVTIFDDKHNAICELAKNNHTMLAITQSYEDEGETFSINGHDVPVRICNPYQVGLPAPEDGVLYVVPRVILQICSEREDLVALAYRSPQIGHGLIPTIVSLLN